MTVLRIDDLLANAPVDPEAHLDAARVERYAGMVDAPPPVVVFETPDGLLLADGYLAAYRSASCRVPLRTSASIVSRPRRRAAATRLMGAEQRGISPEEAASYIERHARNRRT